jgi:hypothetical protein
LSLTSPTSSTCSAMRFQPPAHAPAIHSPPQTPAPALQPLTLPTYHHHQPSSRPLPHHLPHPPPLGTAQYLRLSRVTIDSGRAVPVPRAAPAKPALQSGSLGCGSVLTL